MSTIYSIALKLSLDGVNQLKNSFSIATQEIKKASTGITGIMSNSARQMKELANNSIVQAVGVGAVIAGMTKAINVGIEFEDTFLRATAKIKGGVKQGSEEFSKLESLVLELGAKTEFSTSEAAQGLDFWAKAGKTTNEIMQLLPKSLDMATASGLDLARASDIISDAIGIFNLNSTDMNQLAKNTDRIMDVMSKTVTMTNTSMDELFETSKIAGGIFTTAGQSIETFNASVAILADNSMKGSVAGTNLRAIMAKLASPVAQAREVLDSLGVSISDEDGNMRDFADILDDLKNATKDFGNSQQLAIFKVLADQEAMNGLNFLVKEGGDKLREYRTELEKSTGSTKELADLFRTDTKADWDNFTSAIEGLAIALFKYLQPAIKVVLQSITSLIDLFNEITGDCKTLKILFIGLSIIILSTFTPVSATIIGITLLFAGLVRAFQYCYKEFDWFKNGIDNTVSYIKYIFFNTVDSIKSFINNAVNTFKSFSDSFGTGFLNVLTLINHGLFKLMITPIKWALKAISYLPKKFGGGLAENALNAIDQYEKDAFKYSFDKDDEENRNNKENNKENNKYNNKEKENNYQLSTLNYQLPKAKDITPAVLETKFGNNDLNNNTNNGQQNQASIKQYPQQNNSSNIKSTLDINIIAPKNYSTNYSLNNNQNSPLLINVGNQ